MKKTLTTLVALGALAMASSAFAVIANSLHDLSDNAAATGINVSACEYCHTPHNAQDAFTDGERFPLWNRNNAATTFAMYGDTVAGTSIGTSGAPGPNSMTCLSCHDGVTAMGNLINKGNGQAGNTIEQLSPGTAANLGTDLSDDHPIGFVFVADNDSSPAGHGVPDSVFGNVGAGTGPFRLYPSLGGNTFECASCHDPHDTVTGNNGTSSTMTGKQSGYFLRAPWISICTDCHSNK